MIYIPVAAFEMGVVPHLFSFPQIGQAVDIALFAVPFLLAPTVIGQCAERGRHEIAEGLLTAAPHTTAHLVQIRKPEMLCIVDQNGVRVGDVDTVLDNGG